MINHAYYIAFKTLIFYNCSCFRKVPDSQNRHSKEEKKNSKNLRRNCYMRILHMPIERALESSAERHWSELTCKYSPRQPRIRPYATLPRPKMTLIHRRLLRTRRSSAYTYIRISYYDACVPPPPPPPRWIKKKTRGEKEKRNTRWMYVKYTNGPVRGSTEMYPLRKKGV